MSQLTTETVTEPVTCFEDDAQRLWVSTRKLLAEGRGNVVSELAIQQLLAAAVRLYANKMDTENRYFSPVRDDSGLTVTDVAVVATELLRSVDLSLFDLSMWASRPREDEMIDRSHG